MTYRLRNSRKSNFATELPCPRGGDTTKHENGARMAEIYKATQNYGTSGTAPVDAASRPRPGTVEVTDSNPAFST